MGGYGYRAMRRCMDRGVSDVSFGIFYKITIWKGISYAGNNHCNRHTRGRVCVTH